MSKTKQWAWDTAEKESDNIIVMHNGKIDQIGEHDSLMQKKGRNFALYQSQIGDNIQI